MNRVCIFLSIFLQACIPAKIVGVPAPGTNDSWIQLLIRGIAKIEAIDNVFSESVDLEEDSKTFELERTLSIGAPNARTIGESLVVGKKGSIYIAGTISGGVRNTGGAVGIQDIIFGKYDSQMKMIWTKQIGNANTTLSVRDIAVDTNDNVYVTGNTNRNYPEALTGIEDMFLIKFDSEGNQLWLRQKGIANHGIFPSKMTLDSFGNVYIVGHTDGSFGGPLTGSNGFIIKFKSNGDEDWVRQIGVARAESSSQGIAFDKTTGGIYITGIGNANYETNTLPSIGIRDIFILKYDSNGNGRFFAQLGCTGKFFNEASIAVDPFGNILISGSSNGRFETTLGGANELGTITKYDSRGTLQWIRQFGPTSSLAKRTTISSIITDKNGNIFTTGFTNGNILDDGDGPLGDNDAFLTKHNSSGQSKWIERIGVRGATISGNELKFDPTGNLYVIGNTDRGINGIPMRGTTDIFVVKYK
ncbi:SBBP repeat beta-propeller lipoprotein, LipL53 family [Leptospira weilii]|uniref:SBBP repeat beta-propeller lipoprotein, LipL53 family n=2 Tax=Leptospira weilii TaxID=28184 RepID=UPI0002BF1780|nr:SBBP repeat-containing protein [Leptospira weilii]EMN46562.1 beta-propeller repeat protein [Leptospira weilii str. LNT 1234]